MTPRFHCPLPVEAGKRLALPEAAAHHALRVLRLGDGNEVVVFDGRGGQYRGRLHVKAREVWLDELAHEAVERESPLQVTLAQALAVADKMDWIVQKATELGVAAVQPLAAERSVLKLADERAARRVQHWQGVAVAACEQCGRNRVPAVAPVVSLAEWLAQPFAGQRWLLDPEQGRALREMSAPVAPVALMIGPEGGWSERERRAAQAAGCVPVSFGPRVLRTETAGLAVLAAMQALWGDV